MASRRTGSDILTIETSYLTITIKNKSDKTKKITTSGKKESTLQIMGKDVEKISVFGKEIADVEASGQKGWSTCCVSVDPLFFEQTDYVFLVRSKNGEALNIRGINGEAENEVFPQFDDPSQLMGVVNFDNNVGYSDIQISNEKTALLSVRIEVYPSKISYKEDYRAMMQDIDRMINECVLDFMKKTYHNFAPDHKKSNTPAVFFTILETVYNPFMVAVKRIIAVPHHKLITEHEVVPFYKAKKTDTKSERWLRSHPETVSIRAGKIFAEKVLSVKKTITYDTLENQLVKFMIQRVIKRTTDFALRYKKICDKDDAHVLEKTDRIIKELTRIQTTTFLTDVSDYRAEKSMSLVFEMAPGYRELYKYYLMLLNGISVSGDIFKMSERETATLYEYWCFIKLYEILRSKYELKSPDIIKVNRSGITVDIVKGANSRVVFRNPATGEKIELSYNPKEVNTQTVAQKPDNVLSLEKKGTKTEYKYIFDAKYRIEMNPDEKYPDSQPGPKVDDINTMHRYRDSIVYENVESRFTFEKTMFGAYILFPYPYDEEKYREHRFYKSIDRVNIGGLPFLPSATKLVTELLDELVCERADAAYERTSMPVGIDNILKDNKWKKREVLFGYVPSLSGLQRIINGDSYTVDDYTGAEKQYIILWCEENELIQYYGHIIGSSFVNQDGVFASSDPKTRKTFVVDSWQKFKEPISAKKLDLESLRTKLFNGYANPERHLRMRLSKYLDNKV